jgi:AraC-like DNA-binding protein
VTRDWETLLPLLVHIQAHMEEDLSLHALSRKAGLSPFYLQRLFKALIGETPKAYTSRLRLERGAFRLLVHDSNVLDIALECGFQSHETFSGPSAAASVARRATTGNGCASSGWGGPGVGPTTAPSKRRRPRSRRQK